MTDVTDMRDTKAMLKRYLQRTRDAVLWKLEGLPERDLRLPRTPTGTNLLGIAKHCLNIEAGYFGPTFGRSFPSPEELVDLDAYDADPQADWYATADETAVGIVDLYRRVQAFADETIDALPLDAPGTVPWWPADRDPVSLEWIIVHVTEDVARHAGQADIIRELIDGSAGLMVTHSNLPDYDWPAYVAKLTELAERF